MVVRIDPAPLSGTVPAVPSKSCAQRLYIAAALSDGSVTLPKGAGEDVAAALRCLRALGAEIRERENEIDITPIDRRDTSPVTLECGESGSAYRFLAPVVCALGRQAAFAVGGSLARRPMDELWRVLSSHGVRIGETPGRVTLSGALTGGTYTVRGDISSQYITGLLFALPLLGEDSRIEITGTLRSAGYVDMTARMLKSFGVTVKRTERGFFVPGGQRFRFSGGAFIEGDWSAAAFWLCAGAACGQKVTVTGLKRGGTQGDEQIIDLLRRFGAVTDTEQDAVTVLPGGRLRGIRIDAGNIPDLVMPLCVCAAAAEGVTEFENTARLRLKESDRIAALCALINGFGGRAAAGEDTLSITGGALSGGRADSFGDHRIAMTASALSPLCRERVIITGAEAVNKSYPAFFDHFAVLGGKFIRDEGKI